MNTTTTSPALTLAPSHHFVGAISKLCWSPDGSRLAAASDSGSVAVWETCTGTCLFEQRVARQPITALAWTGQQRCLLVGSDDGTLRLLHLSTRTLALAYTFPERISRIAWCPNAVENRFFVVTGKTLRLFIQRKPEPLTLRYATPLLDACWKPDGQHIALVCQNGLVEVWDVLHRRTLWRQLSPCIQPSGITWDATGQRLAIGTRAGTLQVHRWEDDQPEEEVPLARYPLQALHWGEYGLVARSEDGMVCWHARAQDTSRQPLPAPTTLTLDAQGTLLAMAQQRTIAITPF